MAVTEIAWGDGSNDKIYLNYPDASGDQTVSVSSDANTGNARTKVITFTAGVATETLTVSQDAGYTPVFYNYLYFDGTAYIDTDIIPDSLASYTVPLGKETLRAPQRVFMTQAGNSYNIGIVYGNNTSNTARSISVYYGGTKALATRTYSFGYDTFNFFLTPQRYGIGNNSYAITKGSNTPSGSLVLGYNYSHSGQPYSGRMGTFQIYGSDAENVTKYADFSSYTPIVTLRPCMYGDAAGMWYVEGNKFFGNSASSGTLTVSDS